METVKKESFQVIGIKVEATWNQLWEKMPEAWNTLFERYKEIPVRTDEVLMDISFGKKNDIYTQCIAAEVAGNNPKIPEGMELIRVPQKKYLHYRHTGPLKEIAASFGKMYDHAKEKNLPVGDFKLDIGYTPEGKENHHDLFIELQK